MIISRTPFRVSFMGGGTDIPTFYEKFRGEVFSTTVDKYVYVFVKKNWSDKIRVSYSVNEEVSQVNDLKNTRVKEVLKYFNIENGVEIATISDIPAEFGMGGSSSFVVGLLNAISHFVGVPLSRTRLAEIACELEINKLKEPIGKQDQYAAACGGFNIFGFGIEETLVSPINLSEATAKNFLDRLLFFSTEEFHDSKDILKEVSKGKNEEALRQMASMVYPLMHAIIKEDWFSAGRMLDESWALKKTLSPKISNENINRMYENALDAGALGGKILGAGGGGILMLLAPIEKKAEIKKAISLKEICLNFSKDGSRIIYQD